MTQFLGTKIKLGASISLIFQRGKEGEREEGEEKFLFLSAKCVLVLNITAHC